MKTLLASLILISITFTPAASAATSDQVFELANDIAGGNLPYVCIDPFWDFEQTGEDEYRTTAAMYVCVADKRYGTTYTLPIVIPGVETCRDPEYDVGPGQDLGSVHYRAAYGVDVYGQCRFVDQEGTTPGVTICETASDLSPNGGNSYHYRAGVRAGYGACGDYIVEGDTPQATYAVCETHWELEQDWWEPQTYNYRIGAKVSVNNGACVGYVVEGSTGYVCSADYDAWYNGDLSYHYEVKVRYRTNPNSWSCTSRNVEGDAPNAAVCDTATETSPNGDMSHHYRVGARVRAAGGSCTGQYAEGNTPSVRVCETHWELEQDWWEPQTYNYRVGAKVSVNNGACVGHVQEGSTGYVCSADYDAWYNGDLSYHYEVKVRYRTNPNSWSCNSRNVEGDTPRAPSVEACGPPVVEAYESYGRVYYTVYAKVSVNGGACTGYSTAGSQPIPSTCGYPSVDYGPGNDPDDFWYDVDTGVCLPGGYESLRKSGYIQGPIY